MSEDDLSAIRAQRMAELQGGGLNGGPSKEDAKKMAEQQEMAVNSMLKQLLDQQALARLSNLEAVKPEKARQVQGMIIQMARTGQISGKLSDEGFKQLLDRVSERTQKTTTVKFDRRRAALDSDDED
ncbi:Double-stranded DNA-binding domain containing protein [Aphelenchoides avenae]|nr:Double-stranded DNA-binding domain containing protein [Aphelenchus avenae]